MLCTPEQHERGDEGGEPAGAGGEEVDHDDPAESFDAADGGDHAGQDVEAGQPAGETAAGACARWREVAPAWNDITTETRA